MVLSFLIRIVRCQSAVIITIIILNLLFFERSDCCIDGWTVHFIIGAENLDYHLLNDMFIRPFHDQIFLHHIQYFWRADWKKLVLMEVNGQRKTRRKYYISREDNNAISLYDFGEFDPWTAWAYKPRTISLLLVGTCLLM